MILEDLFDVKNIDEDGKKVDNISRISALSQTYNLELTLVINTEIYPVKVSPRCSYQSLLGRPARLRLSVWPERVCVCWTVQTDERFSLALCTNLRKDGEPDEGVFDQSGLSQSSGH